MGHVVFAAPSIARLHLHERLNQKLLSRGHEVTTLCTDQVSLRCHDAHHLSARLVRSGGSVPPRIPLEEFAIQQCILEGLPHPEPHEIRRRARQLAVLAAGVVHFFERELPDLLLVHQGRGGMHRLMHFVAREFGVKVLWTGDGLLPGTQQIDTEGIDGDSSACRRSALDYRDLPRDPEFLAAALSAWIAHALPPPLARSPRHHPRAWQVLKDLACAVRDRRAGFAREALVQWRCEEPEWPPLPAPAGPGGGPFVALALQDPTSPRIRLDAPRAPTHEDLAAAVAAAISAIDPALQLVIVMPERGLSSQNRWRLPENAQLVTATHTAVVASTALAFVSVNAPLAAGALLAGTPVLHFGRTPYGVPGVARKTSLDGLLDDMRAALGERNATLRERFLYRILRRDHVWCSADFPDQNGLRGLVLAIEIALKERGQEGADLRYSPGPTWPLAQSRRLENS